MRLNPFVLSMIATHLAAGCAKPDESRAEPAGRGSVIGASVATVTVESFPEIVDATGVVAVRPGHVASLSAPSPARVSRVLVDMGAMVRAGQPLVEFEQAAFLAATTSADASLAAAEKALERARRLVEAGVLPRRDVELALADAAQARLNAITAHRAEELSILRSPIAGTVIRMSAMLGANADQGQTLVEVADPSALDVVLNVPPADAGRVRLGQSAALFLGAGIDLAASPVATARVVDVSAVVDSASRGVTVRLRVISGARSLRLGESLFGRVRVAEHANAIVVPLEALVPTGEGFQVFVVDAEGVAHARPVTVGGRSDRGAWITNGLSSTERVVTHGAFGVDDSVRVEGAKP